MAALVRDVKKLAYFNSEIISCELELAQDSAIVACDYIAMKQDALAHDCIRVRVTLLRSAKHADAAIFNGEWGPSTLLQFSSRIPENLLRVFPEYSIINPLNKPLKKSTILPMGRVAIISKGVYVKAVQPFIYASVKLHITHPPTQLIAANAAVFIKQRIAGDVAETEIAIGDGSLLWIGSTPLLVSTVAGFGTSVRAVTERRAKVKSFFKKQ